MPTDLTAGWDAAPTLAPPRAIGNHPYADAVRAVADAVMGGLARVLVRVFFRRVEVEGAERLPRRGPTVLVANHLNGLVDGLLLMAVLRRYPRFLGKSTLFRIPPLNPLLRLAGVVPVYRAQDGAGTERNDRTFSRCRHLPARGGLVALFPEGISHDEPMLQPLRTGAARIALGAAVVDCVEDVVTVAVGLVYDAKARFRSRALVRVGQPERASACADEYRRDPRAAVRALTADLRRQLEGVTPTYHSWHEAETLARIAELASRAPGAALPVEVDLATRERLAQALARVHDAGDPAETELRQRFAAYERDLALLGLDDAQVAAGYPSVRFRVAVAWSVVKVVVALPLAVVGVIVHAVPYQVVKRLARLPRNEGIKATVKLLGNMALLTLLWLVLALVAWARWGGWAAMAVAVLAPLSGYTAVRFAERLHRVGGVVRGYRVVQARRIVLPSVLDSRAQLAEAVWAVAGKADGARAGGGPG